jgi:hypothetical protein
VARINGQRLLEVLRGSGRISEAFAEDRKGEVGISRRAQRDRRREFPFRTVEHFAEKREDAEAIKNAAAILRAQRFFQFLLKRPLRANDFEQNKIRLRSRFPTSMHWRPIL